MTRITKRDLEKINQVTKRKERTLEKVADILSNICKDNPDIFKKAPERRAKSLKRIEEKIKEIKGCDVDNFEEHVRDIAGARVICCTFDEISKVEDLIRSHPEVEKCEVLRKYEDGPDEDGYRGHHLEIGVHVFYENETIRDICEVQIRTLAGDLWAVLSHRDFYKVPTQPPLSVRNDMLTLSKQLGVVDDLAVSLRQRIKDEISKEARQKAKKREPEKDMLTPENVIDLVDKTLKEKISVDFAYELIQYALVSDIVSLRAYKTLITSSKYRTIIENTFAKFGVKPLIEDYLIAPIILASEGIRAGRDIMRDIAKRYREEDITSPEKGVEISREQLEKEVKISGPEERKKKN